MSKYTYFVIILISLICACGRSYKKKSGKIKHSEATIQTSKEKYDLSSTQISCDSIKIEIYNQAGKAKFIIFNGDQAIDTLSTELPVVNKGFEKEIIKMDMNFDGFCDLVVPDNNSIKNSGILHYYFVFDNVLRQFVQNKTLPPYIGGIKLDIKNQRLKLYCPNQECFAYYKYTINKIFEKVQGEFVP